MKVTSHHYFLNYRTCIKEVCDVTNYYIHNLLPSHSQSSYQIIDFNAIREYPTRTTTVIGIIPVSSEFGDTERKEDKGTLRNRSCVYCMEKKPRYRGTRSKDEENEKVKHKQ